MAGQLKLNSDTYLPLRDVVFHTLRDAILRGDLQPGERLMEIHLAQELGVSRTPVREAIRMLEKGRPGRHDSPAGSPCGADDGEGPRGRAGNPGRAG